MMPIRTARELGNKPAGPTDDSKRGAIRSSYRQKVLVLKARWIAVFLQCASRECGGRRLRVALPARGRLCRAAVCQ